MKTPTKEEINVFLEDVRQMAVYEALKGGPHEPKPESLTVLRWLAWLRRNGARQ